MTKYNANPKVDFYFTKNDKWQMELAQMRMIILDCGLAEELKWGVPCYTLKVEKKKSNVVLIHTFKEYCAFLFFKGALLHDANGILIQQTKNVQAARQLRFTNVKEIIKSKSILKAYIYEAMEVEKAGLQVPLKKTAAFEIPIEFQNILKRNTSLKTAFDKLTPGRQRAYLLYFSAPKQSKTRETRIEKYIPIILKGKGLNDI